MKMKNLRNAQFLSNVFVNSMTYGRELQCTCMTQEQYARLRQDPRYRKCQSN